MSPEKYTEWAQLHADLFNLRHQEKDTKLFSLWAPILMPFEFEELRQASYAVNIDPRRERGFREHHVSMLREAILAKRAEAATRESDRLDALGTRSECQDCHGVGLVRVPHPEFILDGRFDRGFFVVVACLCPIGSSKFNAINGKLTTNKVSQRLLDLAQYESIHPDWRSIVAAHREAQALELEAVEFGREVDRVAPIRPEEIRKAAQT